MGECIGTDAAWSIWCARGAIAVEAIGTFVKLIPAKVDDVCIEFGFAELGIKTRVLMRLRELRELPIIVVLLIGDA